MAAHKSDFLEAGAGSMGQQVVLGESVSGCQGGETTLGREGSGRIPTPLGGARFLEGSQGPWGAQECYCGHPCRLKHSPSISPIIFITILMIIITMKCIYI